MLGILVGPYGFITRINKGSFVCQLKTAIQVSSSVQFDQSSSPCFSFLIHFLLEIEAALSKMSYMRGDLLAKTRKLVKGLARAEPMWLKAMEKAPPATFPRAEKKLKSISLPEDVYVNKFFQKHPDSKHEGAIGISGFDPPAARVFAWKVLELKEHGISDEDAIAVADMEYRNERKAKRKAFARLKQIARIQGRNPPPNPYSSAIKEIQAEERKFVHDRFYDSSTREILQKLKQERAAEFQDRRGGFIGS